MSGALQAVFQNHRSSGLVSPLTFLQPADFTVPSGVTSVTVKVFGAGGNSNNHESGGSGAYIIGNFAVIAGDVLHAYNTGNDLRVASLVTWKRSSVVQGYALSGAGGDAGSYGGNGGDNWNDRYGGFGGDADGSGTGEGSSGGTVFASSGNGASTYAAGTGGSGTGAQAGLTGGSGSSGGAAFGGAGGYGGSGDWSDGGWGGNGGGGLYGGGGGAGGNGRADQSDDPNSGEGGGGGGGGSSIYSNLSNVSAGKCINSSDANRGTAGNPDNNGKVVLIW